MPGSPLDRHDAELAPAVGHTVLKASLLDYWVAHLVCEVLGDDDATWQTWFGQTGDRLLRGLGRASERDPVLVPLLAAMKTVVARRNQVVHSIWFAEISVGVPTYESVRPLRKSVTSDDRTVPLHDPRELRGDIAVLDEFVEAYRIRIPGALVKYGAWLPVEQVARPAVAVLGRYR